MDAVNFWNALAQSGIAVLILGIGAWIFWKQIQSLMLKQDKRTETLELNFQAIQKEKDDLQREFSKYIKEEGEKSMQFMTSLQAKTTEKEQQWMKTIQENTEILKDLKQLIEQKF